MPAAVAIPLLATAWFGAGAVLGVLAAHGVRIPSRAISRAARR